MKRIYTVHSSLGKKMRMSFVREVTYRKEGFMSSELKESFKEAGRVVLLAVIPVAIDSLMTNQIDWRLLAITAAVAALRGLDSWLHNSGTLDKGLTRF